MAPPFKRFPASLWGGITALVSHDFGDIISARTTAGLEGSTLWQAWLHEQRSIVLAAKRKQANTETFGVNRYFWALLTLVCVFPILIGVALFLLYPQPPTSESILALAAVPVHERHLHVPNLIKLLDDDKTRHDAVEVLVHYGADAKAAIPALLRCLGKDHMSRTIALAILKIDRDNNEAITHIEKELTSGRVDTRIGDEHIAPTRIIPLLVRLLSHPEASIRSAAAHTLGMYGISARSAVSSLTLTLSDPNAEVRVHVVQALGEIGVPEGISGLIRILRDSDDRVVLFALHALRKTGIGAPEKATGLIRLLGSRNAEIRATTVETIGRLDLARVHVKMLVGHLLGEQDSEVKYSIIYALQDIDHEKDLVIVAVAKCLGDTDVFVAGRANSLLSHMKKGKSDIVPMLTAILDHNDKEVKRLAIITLGEQGLAAKSALPALTALADSADIEIRLAAARSLDLIGRSAQGKRNRTEKR